MEVKPEQGQEAYVTKYALTKGIVKTTIVVGGIFNSSYVYVKWGDNGEARFILNKDLFLTEGEAVRKFEIMRKAKLASLEKQIARLRNLTPTL